MNSLRDILDKLTSGSLPTWALGSIGFVLLLIAMKVAKGILKLVFFALALAVLAGAVWFYLHNHGKI